MPVYVTPILTGATVDVFLNNPTHRRFSIMRSFNNSGVNRQKSVYVVFVTARTSRVKDKSGKMYCPDLVGGRICTKDLKLKKRRVYRGGWLYTHVPSLFGARRLDTG